MTVGSRKRATGTFPPVELCRGRRSVTRQKEMFAENCSDSLVWQLFG